MKKNTWLCILICVVVFISVGIYFYYLHSMHRKLEFQSYFSYSNANVDALKKLKSSEKITVASLKKWDDIIFELIKKNELGDKDASNILSYVYVAQRDAAFISNQATGELKGSIAPLTAEVLCLLLPKDCESIKSYANHNDSYSEEIAHLIIPKIQERMRLNDQNMHLYPEKTGPDYWAGQRPYFGQETGSRKPWLNQRGDEFRAPAPNNVDWQQQLAHTKQALANITPEQKTAVIFWAGNPGTVTPVGQWIINANDYMWKTHTPIDTALEVRAVLAMTIEDAVIAVFDSKYTYWIRRPNMLDPSIQTIMPTPNHPSYPAGHSTISSAARTVLTHYFPANQVEWDNEARDAGFSRVWGGIHFEMDHQAGVVLGDKVAEAALKAEEKKNAKS